MNAAREVEAGELVPIPTSKDELLGFRDVVGGLFNVHWLTSGNHHRLQRLWARRDELAILELASLGHAVQALAEHDKWLKDAARAIRAQARGGHGHLFEILVLGGWAASGAKVRPMPARAAGYDAEITLADGHVLRASIKNHDMSGFEAAFRSACLELDSVVAARVAAAGSAWSVMAGSLAHMVKPTVQALAQRILAIPLIAAGQHYRVLDGEAAVQTAPLSFPNVLPRSYMLLVRSPAHPKEQSNFRLKLCKAIDEFARHSPLSNNYSNVVFMRVHATADVDQLKAQADDLLREPGCVVDAVYFIQSAVAREGKGSVISYYMPVAETPQYDARNVKVTLLQLSGRKVYRPTALQLHTQAGMLADVTGQYLFQRGHLYFQLGSDSGMVDMASPGPGIQTSGVLADGGGGLATVNVHRPEDDELLIL